MLMIRSDSGIQPLQMLRIVVFPDPAHLGQPLGAETLLRESTDGENRAVEAEWRKDDVDARAVGQAGVERRVEAVDLTADEGGDLVDEVAQAGLVRESNRGAVEDSGALDPDLVGAVDHHLADVAIVEDLAKRPVVDLHCHAATMRRRASRHGACCRTATAVVLDREPRPDRGTCWLGDASCQRAGVARVVHLVDGEQRAACRNQLVQHLVLPVEQRGVEANRVARAADLTWQWQADLFLEAPKSQADHAIDHAVAVEVHELEDVEHLVDGADATSGAGMLQGFAQRVGAGGPGLVGGDGDHVGSIHGSAVGEAPRSRRPGASAEEYGPGYRDGCPRRPWV
jgi:hypothetical protein